MTKKWLRMLPVILTAATFLLLSPAQHYAQLFAQVGGAETPEGTPSNGSIETVDASGNRVTCGEASGGKAGVLLGYIVPCVTETISITTENFSAGMLEFFRPMFYAFLVLVVTFYGVKLVQGGQQDAHKEGFLLLLKIALVIGILELMPHTIVPLVYGVMESSEEVVASTLGGGIATDPASISCDIEKYKGPDTPLIWAQMDCVMGKLWGFTSGGTNAATGEKSRNMFLASSLFGMLGGFFFGGMVGIWLFFACIGVLVSVFMLVIRSAISFVNGYMIVCMMLIIAPLFLPLVLLRVTNNYFEPWWKNILGGLLLPVLVTAFAMFALLLYDKMLFAPDALINKILDYKNVESAQQPSAPICSQTQTNDPTQVRQQAGTSQELLNKLFDTPLFRIFSSPQLTGGVDACAAAQLPVFKLSEGSVEFANERTAFMRIFQDCVKLIILGWMIHGGMGLVTNALRTLTGGTSAPTMLLDRSTGGVLNLEKGLQGAEQAAYKEMGSASGTEFIKRALPTMGAAGKGFFSGISR